MFVPGSDPGLAEWVAADMSAAPPGIAVDAMEHAISNDRAMPGLLQQLTMPVVAINPDHRPTDIHALRPHGVKTVLMSGVDLFLMMEDPDTFNRLLGEVLKEFKP
jgi:pimeloyl-ACP methyl ester carboxylesterase